MEKIIKPIYDDKERKDINPENLDCDSAKDIDYNDIQEIESRIFISNGLTAHCLKSLKDNNITHIINVTDNLINKFPEEFDYITIDVEDLDIFDLGIYFDVCIQYINHALLSDNLNNVLVHCMQGLSRSATIICAYLIHKKSMTFFDAIEYVKLKRNIRPNIGFKKQLYFYQVRILDKYDLPKKANLKYYQKGLQIKKDTEDEKIENDKLTNYELDELNVYTIEK